MTNLLQTASFKKCSSTHFKPGWVSFIKFAETFRYHHCKIRSILVKETTSYLWSNWTTCQYRYRKGTAWIMKPFSHGYIFFFCRAWHNDPEDWTQQDDAPVFCFVFFIPRSRQSYLWQSWHHLPVLSVTNSKSEEVKCDSQKLNIKNK